MSYEYKDEILDDIGPEPNSIAQKDSDNYYNKINELNEVYAKAEAFDELVPMLKDAIYILQSETPRTDLHLGAIGAYQTILNHINELESEAD